MKGRSARVWRWASAAIAALLLGAALLIGSQTEASALDLSPCNNSDAPIPASPYGDGSLGVKIGDAGADADPFESPGEVTLESVYGTAPQLWTYDNGCTGQFIAGAGTALGNILLQISGLLPNWTHALMEATVSPDSPVSALDNPVVDATNAVTDAVWKPWLSIVLLIVVVLTRIPSTGLDALAAITPASVGRADSRPESAVTQAGLSQEQHRGSGAAGGFAMCASVSVAIRSRRCRRLGF